MDPLLVEIADRIAVVTLNRPERRNALDPTLIGALRSAMAALDGDDSVDVVVLTGADPAFCAGIDLKALGPDRNFLGEPGATGDASRPWPVMTKPVIGAVNGPAVTGGLELVLRCDFVVASERASFADTHARVGLLPGWGLSVLLPQAVGLRRAKEMSLTGNFVAAEEALRLGLVDHVVPHEQLLAFTRRLAADVAGNDQRAVRALLAEYDEVSSTTVAEGLRIEARTAAGWNSDRSAVGDVARRRQAVIERGRAQL